MSTLVPKDSISALDMLIEPTSRLSAGVMESNQFLFPSTHLSPKHLDGWHATDRICKQAGIESKSINATNQRGRISTMYAGCDVPSSKRQFFYNHMGHNPEVNLGTYQRPLALETINHVGRFLNSVDGGN